MIVTEQRTVSRQALVGYRGNRYSVPPELAAAQVVVTRPVGGQFIDIAITAGIVIARHKLLADGLGATVRDTGHVIDLDAAAMADFPRFDSPRRAQRWESAVCRDLRQAQLDPTALSVCAMLLPAL